MHRPGSDGVDRWIRDARRNSELKSRVSTSKTAPPEPTRGMPSLPLAPRQILRRAVHCQATAESWRLASHRESLPALSAGPTPKSLARNCTAQTGA
jgi:hypothetical protein